VAYGSGPGAVEVTAPQPDNLHLDRPTPAAGTTFTISRGLPRELDENLLEAPRNGGLAPSGGDLVGDRAADGADPPWTGRLS